MDPRFLNSEQKSGSRIHLRAQGLWPLTALSSGLSLNVLGWCFAKCYFNET